MAAQATSRRKTEPETMDTMLWGELQLHIDLKTVYAKLPMPAFFRLRLVCKEWNRLASDLAFLEESSSGRDPIPRPFFVVDRRRKSRPILLTSASSTSASSSWISTPLPPLKCEVGGILLCADTTRVFNLHTRVFHSLPSLEPYDEDHGDWPPLIGMIVDESLDSYQVIHGDESVGTRIYDSKLDSWSFRDSVHELSSVAHPYGFDEEDDGTYPKPTSVYCHGRLYIRVWVAETVTVDLHTYDGEKDEWQVGEPWIPDESLVFCDVGAWQDRLFRVQMLEVGDGVSLWENCGESETEGNWTLFDRMPEELCLWILAGEEDRDAVEMLSKFCGEFVLVYCCTGVEAMTERAVLYNLDKKSWEKVELPS